MTGVTTTAEQMRAWRGPALLSYGFRPFFLGAALWAALAMAVWIHMLAGAAIVPSAFDPVSWHAHEMLFGYLGAVVAGFLLTAVPNWTGRLPIVGWPLAALFGLWLAGRLAVAASATLPPLLVALIDLSMPAALVFVIAREIVSAGNSRNLPVLGLLALLLLANALFHLEAATGAYAAGGHGLRLGLAVAVMMIALIGGRIVPSFTRNWLARRGGGVLPVAPMQGFDRLALAVLLAALALWVVAPDHLVSGLALLAAGVLHTMRLARWAGRHTGAEPLVWVLHGGYAFVPLGALGMGAAILLPGIVGIAPMQHLWMAGAIGLMTMAVMTRATLGHTGAELTAGPGTLALYLALILSVLARLAADFWPAQSQLLLVVSAAAWIGCFTGFAALYGPRLARSRPAG